jgi:hypothetical protein
LQRRSGWQADRVRQRPSAGVSRRTIYDGINERRVERLIDALSLSRASGVAIENLAEDDIAKLAAPFEHRTQSAVGERSHPILRVASAARYSVEQLSVTSTAIGILVNFR